MDNLRNKTIALIGCGDIGCRLAIQLINQGAEVHGFRRNIAALPPNVTGHSMDVQNPATLATLQKIAFDYVIITLSPNELTDAAYKATYVDGLQNILDALDTSALRKLLWVSSTSVYGQNDGSDVDENSATKPARYTGQRQLEAEQLLKPLGDKACIIRFAGIYREGKHHIIEQIRAKKLGSNVHNDYITNRIHIQDCVSVLDHLVNLDAEGKKLNAVYLGVDSSPVYYSELLYWLAKEMDITLPAESNEQTSRVGNKRCLNTRLIESGYRFIYPGYREGFRELLMQTG